jgi:hypothetical protein
MKKSNFWTSIPGYIKVTFTIALFIILIMVVAYPFFIGWGISKDPSKWESFGEYFGSIVSAGNSIAVVFLGYIVYKAQNRRDDWEKHYMAAQEKPILRFIAFEGKSYHLYNMGKGSAHKIIIGKIASGEKAISTPTYKGYSIPSNAYLDVYWSDSSSTLYAYYEGELNDPYLVKCNKDENVDLQKGEERDKLEAYLKSNAARKEKITIHSY